MKVAVLIETENKEPATRAQEGDIIAVRPADWAFGTKERELYLIAIIDLGPDVTEISVARQLEIEDYGDDYLTLPSAHDDARPKLRAKRRYSIPFTIIAAEQASLGNTPVNWDRVRDPRDPYQPLALDETKMPYDHVLRDKVKGRLINLADVQEIEAAIGATPTAIEK